MQEFKTAQTITEYLKNLGLSVATHIGGTGVVAENFVADRFE